MALVLDLEKNALQIDKAFLIHDPSQSSVSIVFLHENNRDSGNM
jgi:hypothetical protein